MRKLLGSVILLAAATLSLFSCSKTSNNINNGQVLQTPYSLYFTDSAGVLYNTNDGKTIKVIFTSDGHPSRALITMGPNILWIKGADVASPGPVMYYSINNGQNFNHNYDSIPSVPMVTVKGKITNLNQSMVAFLPSWNAGYCVSTDPSGDNAFHMAGNPVQGAAGYWRPENYYDTLQITNPHGVFISSFTATKKAMLVAYDGTNNRGFYRPDIQTRWKEAIGCNLPVASSTVFFSLGHINERVIAIDNLGGSATANGYAAYYSDDFGVTWTGYSGLPANTPLQCISSPFEEICLIGTDGAGVYLLNPNTNTWESRNNGLPANTSVRGIAYKEKVYKNGSKAQYVYITTNNGLYQSTDKGNNWVRTYPGNLVSIY